MRSPAPDPARAGGHEHDAKGTTESQAPVGPSQQAKAIEAAIASSGFGGVQEALKDIDWDSVRAGLEAWQALFSEVERAMENAVPLTPATPIRRRRSLLGPP